MQRVQTQSSKVAERSIVGLIWLALVALVTAVAAQDACNPVGQYQVIFNDQYVHMNI